MIILFFQGTGGLPLKKRMSSYSEDELKAKKQRLFAEGRLNTKIKSKTSTKSVQVKINKQNEQCRILIFFFSSLNSFHILRIKPGKNHIYDVFVSCLFKYQKSSQKEVNRKSVFTYVYSLWF